ncbi:MAG TPA: ferredoxin [Bacteroidales bacterium]|nr:MAG: hypothetical protein A2281_15365 [Bacteroidetes bacterium RIFOXYA12_FULL_38_20]HBS86945.1 ferredoxin [Bacteroidales bacterium]
MAIINESEIIEKELIDIAGKMAIAARTAPKGRGQNHIEIRIITGKDIVALSETMKKLAIERELAFFERDAANILQSKAVVVIGARINSLILRTCGMCGFANCDEKKKYGDVPCVFNSVDLGIALGSAASVAADFHADNRIMFSVGQAALYMKCFEEDVKMAFGIPLTATSKSPFFDR